MTVEEFPTEAKRRSDDREQLYFEQPYTSAIEDAIDEAIRAGVRTKSIQYTISRKLLGPLLITNPLRDGQDIKLLDEDLYFLTRLKGRVDGMLKMYENGRKRMTGRALFEWENLDQRRFNDFKTF